MIALWKRFLKFCGLVTVGDCIDKEIHAHDQGYESGLNEAFAAPENARRLMRICIANLRIGQASMIPLLIEQHIEWSRKTFGEGRRTEGLLKHIAKECDEIRENPTDVKEWVDVMILAMDGAWRSGHTAGAVSKAFIDKLAEIKTRTYPMPTSEDEPSEHVRT